MLTAQQIREAVDAGKTVTCNDDAYEVIKDNVGQYLIHFKGSDYYIGLTGMEGTEYAEHLNGSNFVIGAIMEKELGFKNIPVRFFIPVVDDEGLEIQEVSELEFIEYKGEIEYQRHTVRENGCSQICLTKMPAG